MGFLNKIKRLFQFTYNDNHSNKNDSTDTNSVRAESVPQVSAMATTTNIQPIFDVDPINTIPRDIHYTPLSVLAGLVLDGSESAILGYKIVKVNDDGSVNVNVTGATLSTGDITVGTLDNDDGSVSAGQSDLMLTLPLLHGYTGSDWERISSTAGSLNVNITGGTSSGSSDDDDGSVSAGQSDLVLNIDLLYGYNGIDWERLESISNRLLVDGSGVTQPISAISLPLPTGAATESTLGLIKTNTDKLDVNLSTRASESTLSGIKSQTDQLTFTATRLLVDGSGVTQPISGTITANIGTTGGLLLDTTFTGRINTLGQKTMANSTPVVISSDQSTLNTDPTDKTTRELGRILASDNVYTSETYTTTNTAASARPINGDFNTRHYKTKYFIIKNTHATFAARINVFGSVDNGTNFDVTISNNIKLNAGSTLEVTNTDALTHVRVEARADAAGNQATIDTRAYALGV